MRNELTDYEWTAIQPFLPDKPRGVPRVTDRRVLNGIFGSCAPAHHGVIFLATLALIRLTTTASFAGAERASGTAS